MLSREQQLGRRLKRLPVLLEAAYARGDHELYGRLRVLNFWLLHELGWKPPPLNRADQEAVRRGELFTDIRAWQRSCHRPAPGRGRCRGRGDLVDAHGRAHGRPADQNLNHHH